MLGGKLAAHASTICQLARRTSVFGLALTACQLASPLTTTALHTKVTWNHVHFYMVRRVSFHLPGVNQSPRPPPPPPPPRAASLHSPARLSVCRASPSPSSARAYCRPHAAAVMPPAPLRAARRPFSTASRSSACDRDAPVRAPSSSATHPHSSPVEVAVHAAPMHRPLATASTARGPKA